MNQRRYLPIFRLTFVIALAVASVSCGGGSSSITFTPDEVASGIWHGTVTNSGGTSDIGGLITEDKEVILIGRIKTGVLAYGVTVGTLDVTGDVLSGTVQNYGGQYPLCFPCNFSFPDGSSIATLSLSGTVATRATISGSFSGGGDSGTFSLAYDTIYERPSSLSAVSANWTFSSPISGITTTVSIDPAGLIFGTNTDGCVYSGTVSVIDPFFNAYRVEVTVSSCGAADGTYSGLAALADTVTTDDTLNLGVTNADNAMVFAFARV